MLKREILWILLLRGRRSRNKVFVGEPAKGSFRRCCLTKVRYDAVAPGSHCCKFGINAWVYFRCCQRWMPRLEQRWRAQRSVINTVNRIIPRTNDSWTFTMLSGSLESLSVSVSMLLGSAFRRIVPVVGVIAASALTLWMYLSRGHLLAVKPSRWGDLVDDMEPCTREALDPSNDSWSQIRKPAEFKHISKRR